MRTLLQLQDSALNPDCCQARRSDALPAPASAAARTPAAAAPSESTASTTATTESSARARLVLSFVHLEAAPVEILAVELRDGGLGVGIGSHRDERESTGPPGLAVARDGNLFDGPTVRSERSLQCVLGGGEVEVADVELATHGIDR